MPAGQICRCTLVGALRLNRREITQVPFVVGKITGTHQEMR